MFCSTFSLGEGNNMVNYPMLGEGLAVGIILLFVGTCLVPVTGQDAIQSLQTARGDWLYVGGTGLGNYTRIQDAIDNASDGDTVFVYDDLAPYYEFLTIDHSLRLLGENRNSTVIYGSGRNDIVVLITAQYVTVQGFTLLGDEPSFGVMVNADNATIVDVWVRGLQQGIMVMAPNEHSLVKNCLIQYCVLESDYGVYTQRVWNVTIRHNFFSDNYIALALFFSFNCTISSNLFLSCHRGIHSDTGANNKFIDNTIVACDEGIFLEACHEQVIRNNFLNVTNPAYFYRHPWIYFILIHEARLYPEYEYNRVFAAEFHLYGPSLWDENYWDETKTELYLIPGWRGDFFAMLAYTRNFPPNRLAFDRHPAQEPYDFPVVPS
ncbi:MAG: right-handed parallel beta-helix repeat-containing protein [Candidatus Thermoplasmatota archaeon]|nr:right-handed parallel beta-helix repeat-containing protein [Candidatus Thermoplasmatota archaeon]